MKTILRIDSSSRTDGSHSRELADYFQTIWQKKNPQDQIIIRDIVKNPCPHISNLAIAGFQSSPEKLTPEMKAEIALSDELITELLTSDILLISVPMYNFSVPSSLKAWIDQIVRIEKTFAYDGTSFSGLLTGKKAYIICTYGAGGYTNGGSFSSFNFLEPYLNSLLSFLGFEEIQFFNLEATVDKSSITQNTDLIKQTIDQVISES